MNSAAATNLQLRAGRLRIKITSIHGAPGTGYPHWSPDGKWIVFHSDKDIYLVPSTGGIARNLTNHPALDDFPSFSRRRQLDLLQLEPDRGRSHLENALVR